MAELHEIRCIACEGGISPLSQSEIQNLLLEVKEWELSRDGQQIIRHYSFKDFYQTIAFVNAVAWVANQEGHHPDMEIGYNYCTIKFMTHAVKALTQNDFICAAKINRLSIIA